MILNTIKGLEKDARLYRESLEQKATPVINYRGAGGVGGDGSGPVSNSGSAFNITDIRIDQDDEYYDIVSGRTISARTIMDIENWNRRGDIFRQYLLNTTHPTPRVKFIKTHIDEFKTLSFLGIELQVPRWVKHVGADENGTVWGYDFTPRRSELYNHWSTVRGKGKKLATFSGVPDWKNSLQNYL